MIETPRALLTCTDALLLRDCEVQTFRASGPGGQKRNKTSSAVRVCHRPTGISAQASESRSQHDNRRTALRRLRRRFAVELRSSVDLTRYRVPVELAALLPGSARPVGRRTLQYVQGAQQLLDLLEALDGSVSETAQRLAISTGQLSRLILRCGWLSEAVNRLRAQRALRPLR